ncbi:gas vesicle protein K [Streptomyces filamentosus]|uniref:gas vesicle protein K n=1 Tax=Streptomyces filamentosus TaxID=67294 RepID=UPI001238A551|nr:gas vesicle protein K [Streptomyces filamentosus]KAA6216334.1 gas vesicle protein K [Streptomyces filamentosus]
MTGRPADVPAGLPPGRPAGSPADRLGEVADAARRARALLPPRPELPERPEEADPPAGDGGRARVPARRLRADPDTVERDLVALVLTVVELLRQLMERQALHRADRGDLTEEQEERLGLTLMLLHDRMTELCEHYGLALEDLNIDLGPLGPLLPP